MAGCAPSPPNTPGPLIQIHRGYATDCCGLRLSVEVDVDGWIGEVVGGGGPLYRARRCSLGSAKIAAAEFAVWSGGSTGRVSPEAMTQHLVWREYW